MFPLHTFLLYSVSKLKRNATDSSFFSRLPLYGSRMIGLLYRYRQRANRNTSKEAAYWSRVVTEFQTAACFECGIKRRLHSCRVEIIKLLLTNNDVRRGSLRNGSAVNPAQRKKGQTSN